jgi:HD-GYP domain-containing protein (c-di-GMP phosphodiesterase class II)
MAKKERRSEAPRRSSDTSAQILELLVDAGIALSEVEDFEQLKELICETALNLGQCEGVSLYEAQADGLHFIHSRNRVLEVRHGYRNQKLNFKKYTIPIANSTLAGYCAVQKKPVNVADVYHLPPDSPFSYNSSFDKANNYRSVSMLAIPMCDSRGILMGVLQLINRNDEGSVVAFPEFVENYLRALASQFAVVLRNARMAETLRLSRIETVRQFVKASEYHDKDTGGHIERMSRYSVLLYRVLGYGEVECETLRLASMLHDVGKISIPDAVLKKPGKLDEAEFEIMKTHAVNGYKMLCEAESPLLQMGAQIALRHHEKWNGSGYPDGLKGEDIPIEGRVVAVADVFDALCAKRCYKDSWPLEKVIDTIYESSGTHFQPELVDIFRDHLGEVFQILEEFPPETGKANIQHPGPASESKTGPSAEDANKNVDSAQGQVKKQESSAA